MVPSFQEVDRRDDEGFRIAQNRPFSFFLRNLSSRKHRALAGGLLKRGSCFGCLSLAALCALVLRFFVRQGLFLFDCERKWERGFGSAAGRYFRDFGQRITVVADDDLSHIVVHDPVVRVK